MPQNKWPLSTEITKRIVELACWHEPDDLPGIGQYAGVCREWRDLVERQTFQTLRLDRARLVDVDRIVGQRRQAYVCTVGLDVELEPYGVEAYGDFETAEENERNSSIFSETLRLFFDVFSRWAPGGNGLDRAGISLRITAFSPSDVCRCGEAEMKRRSEDVRSRDVLGDRYIHSILQLLPAATELPVVESVSELISGKERHISAPAWALIINSLPNAKKIDINFWENEKKDLELRKRLRDGTSLNQSSQNRVMRRSPSPNRDWRCPHPNPLPRRRGGALMQLRGTKRPRQQPADTCSRARAGRRLHARPADLGAAAQGAASLQRRDRARSVLSGGF